jgi:hypothetical protein
VGIVYECSSELLVEELIGSGGSRKKNSIMRIEREFFLETITYSDVVTAAIGEV